MKRCVYLLYVTCSAVTLFAVQEFVLHPKTDVYGLGFDPLKNAPEFKGTVVADACLDWRISLLFRT